MKDVYSSEWVTICRLTFGAHQLASTDTIFASSSLCMRHRCSMACIIILLVSHIFSSICALELVKQMESIMSLADIFGLQNKVGFLTGAGAGLGAEMAEALAVAGVDVVLAGRNVPKLEVVSQRICDLGRKALVCQVDVTQEDMIEKTRASRARHSFPVWPHRLVQEIVPLSHMLTSIVLDVLINNAGTLEGTSVLHEMSSEEWRRVMSVDLDGVFYVSKAVLEVMLKQGSGKIINIASQHDPIALENWRPPAGVHKACLVDVQRASLAC
ncbi:NAD(P)-binding protein [Athelia psychrophila]|uniref:NAD(P)-binding protein n=1 Tax=Athelia psychrophila TaxID=1759441 RepID=A0A166HG73_9AGAM|nr:NAD(P)-binding protein [Fibularhizoctonia sp. CBS 109695]